MDTPTDTPPDAAQTADEALAARLKIARDQRGFSQAAVAGRSKRSDPEGKGISRTAIIGYESASSRPGARELRILCEVLAVTPNWLLFGSGEAFKAQHVAMEMAPKSGKQAGVTDVVAMATVLTALKGHERDALYSLIYSLAGRQLGDVRLSGLHMMGVLLASSVEQQLRGFLRAGEDIRSVPLEELAERISQQVHTSEGSRVRFDEEGEPTSGTVTYPDPKL
jgi:transcriptional regulator with XRE-family HTH domain